MGVSLNLDESIAELATKLDRWLDRSLPVFSSENRAAQDKAIRRRIAIITEFDRLKAKGMDEINAVLNQQGALPNNDRKASLIRAFEFGAKLGHALHDEFLDTKGKAEVGRLLDKIVLNLDKIGVGRSALDVLFASSDAGVRASAGAYLIDLMPERVVPMLQHIDEAGSGGSAGFRASWALLAWDREGKSRFNYLICSPSVPMAP